MIRTKWQTEPGCWDSRSFGEFYKQTPRMILFPFFFWSLYLAFFCRSWASTFENPDRTCDTSAYGSIVFLLFSGSYLLTTAGSGPLFPLCLLWVILTACLILILGTCHSLHTKHKTLQTTHFYQNSGSILAVTSPAPLAYLGSSHNFFPYIIRPVDDHCLRLVEGSCYTSYIVNIGL